MSEKGFISAPTIKQLEMTPAEKEKMRQLWEWQEASKRSKYIFGPSIHCKCGAMNNPNNVCCHQCGAGL